MYCQQSRSRKRRSLESEEGKASLSRYHRPWQGQLQQDQGRPRVMRPTQSPLLPPGTRTWGAAAREQTGASG